MFTAVVTAVLCTVAVFGWEKIKGVFTAAEQVPTLAATQLRHEVQIEELLKSVAELDDKALSVQEIREEIRRDLAPLAIEINALKREIEKNGRVLESISENLMGTGQ